MKKLINLLTALLLSIFVIACGTEKKEASTEAKMPKYVVGTNAEFAPFEYLEKDQIVGFDVDLMNLIAKYAGFEFEWKDMAFDALMPSLQTKKIDLIIAGLTKTPDREKSISFSDSYFASKQIVIVPKDVEVSSFDDLVGKKVGVMLGFTGDTLMTEKEGVNVERYPAAYAGLMALNEKKIDAVVLDQEVANKYIVNYPDLKIADIPSDEELCCVGARKEDSELLAKVNEALAKIKESGEYDQLIKKYFN